MPITVQQPHPVPAANGWRVWGQDHLVEQLKRAISRGPSHAYILSGAESSGKNLIAAEFARALNCRNAPGPALSCGECSACRRIQKGVFPDVGRFSLESQAVRENSKTQNLTLNIATVREISSTLALRPSESNWRVVIVDDVQTMQEPAQEAFLKTLEEPPSYGVILLLTTDADLLMPTIRSRCVTLRLGTPSPEVTANALTSAGVEESKATELARLSEASIGWAFRAAEDDGLRQSREQRVTEVEAWLRGSPYERMVKASLLGDQFTKDREAVYGLIQATQGALRDRLYALNDPQALRQLSTGLRAIDQCLLDLEANVRPKAAMLTMVQDWPQPSLLGADPS